MVVSSTNDNTPGDIIPDAVVSSMVASSKRRHGCQDGQLLVSLSTEEVPDALSQRKSIGVVGNSSPRREVSLIQKQTVDVLTLVPGSKQKHKMDYILVRQKRERKTP